MVLDVDQAEADLTRGALAGPRCAGLLRTWSWANLRRVRLRDGTTRAFASPPGQVRVVSGHAGAPSSVVPAPAR